MKMEKVYGWLCEREYKCEACIYWQECPMYLTDGKECETACPCTETVELINLTPHAVMICNEDGEVKVTVPASGELARVEQKTEKTTTYFKVGEFTFPVTHNTYGQVTGLPAQDGGKMYVVSRQVAEAATGRTDLLVPNQSIRNSEGVIVGCLSLAEI